jgi:small subunit ribosomal protein S20
MANPKKIYRHRSALKAHRESLRRYAHNRAAKKNIRLSIRAAVKAAATKDGAKMGESAAQTTSLIDKAARRGLIHWKAAARKKSRLMRRLAAQMRAPAAPASA